jgi:Domain of unknown function (DUF1937)
MVRKIDNALLVAKLNEMVPFVYLATPYSKFPGGIHAAFRAACEVAGWLVHCRVRVYCPIAHTHPIAIAGNLDPHDHKIWLPADRPFMDAAGGLLVAQLPTWEDSFGIAMEIETFQKAGKPIEYLPWPMP